MQHTSVLPKRNGTALAAHHHSLASPLQLHGCHWLLADSQALQHRVLAAHKTEDMHPAIHTSTCHHYASSGIRTLCIGHCGHVTLEQCLGEAKAHGCHVIHAQHAQRVTYAYTIQITAWWASCFGMPSMSKESNVKRIPCQMISKKLHVCSTMCKITCKGMGMHSLAYQQRHACHRVTPRCTKRQHAAPQQQPAAGPGLMRGAPHGHWEPLHGEQVLEWA